LKLVTVLNVSTAVNGSVNTFVVSSIDSSTKTERKQQEARKKDLLRQIRGDRISEALYSGRIYVKGNKWCTNMSHPDNIKFINNTIESVKKMDICDKQC
jgi:hypothetical protein